MCQVVRMRPQNFSSSQRTMRKPWSGNQQKFKLGMSLAFLGWVKEPRIYQMVLLFKWVLFLLIWTFMKRQQQSNIYVWSVWSALVLYFTDSTIISAHLWSCALQSAFLCVCDCFSQKALTWSEACNTPFVYMFTLKFESVTNCWVWSWLLWQKRKKKSMKLAIQKDPQMNALHSAEEIQVCCT